MNFIKNNIDIYLKLIIIIQMNTQFKKTNNTNEVITTSLVNLSTNEKTKETERHSDESGYSAISQDKILSDRSLLAIGDDSLKYLLSFSVDNKTFLKLRLVAKIFYNLSVSFISPNFPLFLSKFHIRFHLRELISKSAHEEAKLEFAQKHDNVVLKIRSNEVMDLYELLSANKLAAKRQSFLSQIKGLDFTAFAVTQYNINAVNFLLNFFADQKRASQLKTLIFGDILGPLTLPNFTELTTLEFIGTIGAEVKFPTLSKLEKLILSHMIAFNVKVPSSPKLLTLILKTICAEIEIGPCPELKTLTLQNITHRAKLRISSIPQNLTTFNVNIIATKDLDSIRTIQALRRQVNMSNFK